MKLFQHPISPGNRLLLGEVLNEVLSVDLLRGVAVLRCLTDNSIYSRPIAGLLAECMDGSAKVYDKHGLALRIQSQSR